MASVTRYQDLDCHKLAVEVRREVLRLTRRETVRKDFRFVSQIRDSARSAPHNIAEGYSRFNPTEILQFLSYAKASLHETENHLTDGVESSYFAAEEAKHVTHIIRRCIGAILKWMAYLHSPAARRFYEAYLRRRRGPATNKEPEPGTRT